MKDKIISFSKHPLISGSSIVLIGTFMGSVLQWVFVLLMGGQRLLSVSDFGILSSLSSIITLVTIFQTSLTSIFAKFTAQYKAREDHELLAAVVKKGFKITIVISLVVVSLLIVLTLYIGSFLHIENSYILLVTFLTIFFALLTSLPFGVLQGEMKFFQVSAVTIINPVLKILCGVIFVLLGMKVFGAVVGINLAFLAAFLASIYFIRKDFFSKRKKDINDNVFYTEFKNYSLKFFFAALGIAIISNADIILVKHFFNAIDAGHYSALSIIGKAIFYVTSPLYFVFFPLIAFKKEKNEDTTNTLLLAGGIILLCSIGLSLIYFLFPGFVLAVLFPAKEYNVIAPLLGPFSLYIVAFSLAYLMNNFLLSMGKTNIYPFNLLAGFAFILGIFLFHNTLYEVIVVLCTVSFLLFVTLLLYYLKNGRH